MSGNVSSEWERRDNPFYSKNPRVTIKVTRKLRARYQEAAATVTAWQHEAGIVVGNSVRVRKIAGGMPDADVIVGIAERPRFSDYDDGTISCAVDVAHAQVPIALGYRPCFRCMDRQWSSSPVQTVFYHRATGRIRWLSNHAVYEVTVAAPELGEEEPDRGGIGYTGAQQLKLIDLESL